MAFHRGDAVEICSTEEGFLGSYYAATVISPVGKSRVLVQYQTLLTSDESMPLREIIRAAEVRPTPPDVQVSDFSVFDEVDAFHNDGWWVGRITHIEGPLYYVYFSNTADEIAYPFSQLRVHQEWKKGKWVPLLKRR
ncbi:PREDICTED: DUF724 domain-containing protein 3-like [Nelumbo nucifera]|uniref:Agenet domain-containing protein n=2 Tax=Nelumbo nucifera TaxID=4432 RepID=A0A822XLE8_NELNU|nr:PREDICTED: DUF724 domain-containing protein 3-like [Nelumbo nucifera]DAD21200.1 TPA_asm: hypothetical protein HUJ06_022663 [Nelumbo nucifera]